MSCPLQDFEARKYEREECDGVCFEPPDGTFPVCVESLEPSSICPAEGSSSLCDGDDMVACYMGLESSRAPCPIFGVGEHCVEPDGIPFCAVAGEPSELCGSASVVCNPDLSTLVMCRDGYETGREPCGDGRFCDVAADTCAPFGSGRRTRACRGIDEGTVCDNEDVVQCRRGYEIRRTHCRLGCASDGESSRCADPSDPSEA